MKKLTALLKPAAASSRKFGIINIKMNYEKTSN